LRLGAQTYRSRSGDEDPIVEEVNRLCERARVYNQYQDQILIPLDTAWLEDAIVEADALLLDDARLLAPIAGVSADGLRPRATYAVISLDEEGRDWNNNPFRYDSIAWVQIPSTSGETEAHVRIDPNGEKYRLGEVQFLKAWFNVDADNQHYGPGRGELRWCLADLLAYKDEDLYVRRPGGRA
jgi:hypothetical protein